MLKQKNKKGNEGVESFLSSVLAVAAGLLFGLFILLITNSNEMFSGFLTILQGGFVDGHERDIPDSLSGNPPL